MTCDLNEFVNREDSIAAFEALLGRKRQRIFLLNGPENIGKSCLLWRLRQISREKGYTSVLVDLADPRLTQPEDIILHIAERLGGALDVSQMEHDKHLQLEYLEYGKAGLKGLGGGGVSLSGQTEVGGDVVGGAKITLNNSPVIVNVGGENQAKAAIRNFQLNSSFKKLLLDSLSQQPLVILFDHLTKEPGQQATEQVQIWLRYTFIAWLIEEQDAIDNLRIIVAGRQPPFATDVNQWHYLVQSQEVNPFSPEAITQFWVGKRELETTHLPGFIQASGGIPGLLSLMAKNIEAAKKAIA